MRNLFVDLRPAREFPAYRRLLTGSLVTSLGTAMTTYAVALQVWDITRSSFAVGALGFTFFPTLAFGLIGGSFADSTDRKRLALTTSTALMAVSAIFAAQSFADLRQVWLLYVLVTVQAMLRAIGQPARRTFVPKVVPPEQLKAAIALNTLSGRMAMLFGPALAGVMTGAWGLKACYLVDACSFLAAIYATARLPAMPGMGARRKGQSRLSAAVGGLRYIRRKPVLIGVFLSDLNAMLFGLPVALFPALNAAHFGGSPQTLGLLSSAVGVGGLIAAVLSGRTVRVQGQGFGMLAATAVWGAAIAGFALVRNFPAGLALLVIAGAADTLTVTFGSAIVQIVTPDEFRGRVSGVEYVIGSGSGPLGNVESGAVAALTGSATVSAFSGGVACLIGTALIALAFPAFMRYGRVVPEPARQPETAS